MSTPKKRTCATCEWCRRDENEEIICANSDSKYNADYVDNDHVCDDYQESVG